MWHPIETAPADGTHVLVWWPRWSAFPTIAYVNKVGRWVCEAAISEDGDEPSHWTPLPDPPVTAELPRHVFRSQDRQIGREIDARMRRSELEQFLAKLEREPELLARLRQLLA